MIEKFLSGNGLVVAFLVTAITMVLSTWMSKKLSRNKVPDSAIAIFIGLILAYVGGVFTNGKKGISDIPALSGFALMGGAMFRDFAVVSTAMGARFSEIKKAGWVGVISLLAGVTFSFILGGIIAYAFGYSDAKSITTIGAGACTFIVGPITGAAIGAESELIAISIATGVVKAILVTIITPPMAKLIKLNNPTSAMAYGGLIGTTSGVAAGLAATDPELVPYGAMTATFYTGLGCLLCPSVFYFTINSIIA
jgi:malonate transporter MadM subunit